MFSQLGDVINMTQYPESVLAREKELCYASICVITDYDAGLGIKNQRAVHLKLRAALFLFAPDNSTLLFAGILWFPLAALKFLGRKAVLQVPPMETAATHRRLLHSPPRLLSKVHSPILF